MLWSKLLAIVLSAEAPVPMPQGLFAMTLSREIVAKRVVGIGRGDRHAYAAVIMEIIFSGDVHVVLPQDDASPILEAMVPAEHVAHQARLDVKAAVLDAVKHVAVPGVPHAVAIGPHAGGGRNGVCDHVESECRAGDPVAHDPAGIHAGLKGVDVIVADHVRLDHPARLPPKAIATSARA